MDKVRDLIARFSLLFVKNFRVTIILFVGIILLGFLSYTTLLKKEGFPTISFPGAVLSATYFVGDAEKVNKDVTTPIESSLSNLTEIKEISSTTTENGAFFMAELEEGISSDEAVKSFRDEIGREADLPKDVELNYMSINAGAIDGENDLIFSITDSKSIKELQDKAGEIAKEVAKAPEVSEAESLDLITKQINPLTGQEFDFQSGFNRVGYKKDGELIFKEAVNIGVKKKKDVGTIDLSNAVVTKLDELKSEGEIEGYDIVMTGDFARSVGKQQSSLLGNALNGLIVVVLVVLLLISYRASIVTAIFLPTAIGATLIGLFLLGYSLNIIVMFALILLLGLLVDDAVIVVEAIDREKRRGKKGYDAIKSAIRSIGVADVSGTITTILVFLPMAFISGILGQFIVFIPITIVLALSLSILIALTIVPYISSLLIPDMTKNTHIFGDAYRRTEEKIINGVGKFVNAYLSKARYTILVILGTIVLIGVGLFFSAKLKFTIFPTPKDSLNVIVQMTFPENTDIDTAEGLAQEAETIIVEESDGQIEQVAYFVANKTQALIMIELTEMKDRDITSTEIKARLDSKFTDFEGATLRVESEGAGPPTTEFNFFVQIFSDDENTLKNASKEVETYLKDKEIADGEKVTETRIDNLTNITKKDKRRYAEVKAKITDPSNSGLIMQLETKVKEEFNKEKLKDLGLEKDDMAFDQGMESENVQSFQSAIFALAVSFILIYIVLVLQFNSFLQPFLILFAIPFTFVGLFPGLFFTDNPFSFFVMVGIIALSGIVVNNTILLTDYANQLREKGRGIREAIVEAIKVRLRPLVVTSMTTIGGLLPLSLSDPFWESLGFTIIFGLLASTTLVILAFPAFYALVEKLKGIKLGSLIRK